VASDAESDRTALRDGHTFKRPSRWIAGRRDSGTQRSSPAMILRKCLYARTPEIEWRFELQTAYAEELVIRLWPATLSKDTRIILALAKHKEDR